MAGGALIAVRGTRVRVARMDAGVALERAELGSAPFPQETSALPRERQSNWQVVLGFGFAGLLTLVWIGFLLWLPGYALGFW